MSEAGFGIYIHIPFCVRKCPYCDFVSGPGNREERLTYLAALQSEIRGSTWGGARARTVYFGGGTPSELGTPDLRRVFDTLQEVFEVAPEAECSIECNPGTLSKSKLARMRSMGFNRLSLGVQSFDDRFLRLLGRIHTSAEAWEACRLIRVAGFGSVNLDLIFGLPGQTLEDWCNDLRKALDLRPEHLSLYGLTIESETEFGRLQRQGVLQEIDEDLAATMYETAVDLAAAAGYRQYEISNFALPGRECRHNLIYWHNEEYLGFGVGAASYVDGVRWSNIKDRGGYTRAASDGQFVPPGSAGVPPACGVCQFAERLNPRRALGEEIMLRLRLNEGFSSSELRDKYSVDPEFVYSETIQLLVSEGLLARRNGSIVLTSRGRLLANEVCRRFL